MIDHQRLWRATQPRTDDPMRAQRLRDLKRLLHVRERDAALLNDYGLRLLDQAIVAVIGDLRELGAQADVRACCSRVGL